jgi:hypothetical protein
MAHQTIRDSERLTKLSEGKCDLDDVDAVVERVVSVAVMGVIGGGVETGQGASVPEIDDLVLGTTNAPYRRSIHTKELVDALTSGKGGTWTVHLATFFTDVRPELVLRFAKLHDIPARKLISTYGEIKQATGEANPALENLLEQLAPAA